MLFLECECPHCGEKRGMKVFSVSEYTADGMASDIKRSQVKERSIAHPKNIKKAVFFASGYCAYCKRPILVELDLDRDYLYALRDHVANPEKLYAGPNPSIKNMWPAPVPPYSHPALPEKVRVLFVDLQTMLKQRLAPSLIITGCRSILEAAVKELGGEGKWLGNRINDLKNKAIVNGVLFEWATKIQLDGNAGAHELAGAPEEAAEMVEFTRLFLQYTFEFPARVREARSHS